MKPKFKPPRFIFIEGWEVHINDDLTVQSSRSGERPRKIVTKARRYLKGLKKIWKDKPSFSEIVGEHIHGNKNDAEQRYEKIVRQLNEDQIVAIGEGASFQVTSYVDGSYTVKFW